MINEAVSQIDAIGSKVADLLVQEENVLLSAIKKCGGSLGKNYSHILSADINPNCIEEIVWSKADVMVKLGKYNVAMAAGNKLSIKLIVYTKTKSGFTGNIAATGWAACREKVSLDEILESIVKELSTKKTQITNNTHLLLSQI